MDIDEYLGLVEHLAGLCKASEREPFEFLSELDSTDPRVRDGIDFRKGVLSISDEEHVDGFLEFGFFQDGDEKRRKAGYAFGFDVLDCPLFVRLLDPDHFDNQKPRLLLGGSVVVPGRFDALMKFNMYPGQREYGEYDLKDYVTPDDTSAYLGYMVDRLRRLEIRAERRESEYLSMIIEEVASIEGIPLIATLPICAGFLRSRIMLADWIKDLRLPDLTSS
jgi:hypothetical protein